jgi:6-phospho-beta-glucosidase
MKISIIGAAGVRTPLIVQAMLAHRGRLGLTELSLMDIDGDRLELIGALTSPIEHSSKIEFCITRTTDPQLALTAADFVITTFRVGGIESRIIDERVPLNHGILGQETTGAGGFALGIRSVPVILDYVRMMQKVCPHAWLINFANPAGMLTEAVLRYSDWQRVVGICDGPTSMHAVISAILGAKQDSVYLDYFGLNHLGWIKRIVYKNQDRLSELIELINLSGGVPGLPFDPDLIVSLGMIPNEYLYYYYYNELAISNILHAGECRGEQVASQTLKLYTDLREKFNVKDYDGMQAIYHVYMDARESTYMLTETGNSHGLSVLDPKYTASITTEGYAGVALDLIEGLIGKKPIIQILNVSNNSAIPGMDDHDVVEIPTLVSHGEIRPMVVGDIPTHCLGLIQQVKHYERLTIQASIETSYQKALMALTLHPLIRDFTIAKSVLDDYMKLHHNYFPPLQ